MSLAWCEMPAALVPPVALDAPTVLSTPNQAIINYMNWLGEMTIAERTDKINKCNCQNRIAYLRWTFSMPDAARAERLGYSVAVNPQ